MKQLDRSYFKWLYLSMVVSGVIMFYYGAEVHPDFFLLMGFSLMFMGFLLLKHECETVLINRHKMIEDVTEEKNAFN